MFTDFVRSLAFVQLTITVAALAAIELRPPPTGQMMLMPLWQGDADAVAGAALAADALLLGPGPLPGSLVVAGQRARIARQIDDWSVAILAAPSAGCHVEPRVDVRASGVA